MISPSSERRPVRVLHSFPHKIGSGRIADTAWHEVDGAARAGAEMTVFPGVVHRPLSDSIEVRPTLARGRWRLPYRALGLVRTLALHDRLVARRLERLADRVDVVHAWPLAARETLKTATRLGIVTVLERPNAHTRYAYEAVQAECERLGVELPPGYEHSYNDEHLRIEEEEYALADFLLCASEFSAQTFIDRGFAPERLIRHTYGYEPRTFYPPERRRRQAGLTVLFAGLAAVRKGLHFALEAWVQSPASRDGTFLIAGGFLPAYADRIADLLAHPSVRVLGHRTDVAELMRESDVFVLPSVEEGYGIVCVEALATGCVPLVSNACTDVCVNGENAFVHSIGDVATLETQITALHADRELLDRMSTRAVESAASQTWDDAGRVLVDAYEEALRRKTSLPHARRETA